MKLQPIPGLREHRARLDALGPVPIRTGLTVIEETGPHGQKMTHFVSQVVLEHWQAPRFSRAPQIVTESPATLLLTPRASARKESA